MKRIVLLLATVFLVSSCDIFFGNDDWELVWSDEFNGAVLDSAYWNYEIGNGAPVLPGWGNNELEYYTSRTENVRIEDFSGADRGLVIEARAESYSGFNYTSARIQTKGKVEQTYGRIEARIKLPKGKGIWPAFWMLGNDIDTNNWPACGEIDIVELVGHEPDTVHGTIHFGEPWQYTGNSFRLPSGDFSDDFHIFAIEWEPGEIRWYVDDTLYSRKTSWFSSIGSFPAPFNKDFFLILNVAVGGNWPGNPDGSTVFPQRMYVDYIRIYEAKS
jgi:beta-glucanase (GH16 family)